MIDLTPLDVRNKRGDFGKQLRGYDPDEVDAFLALVAERLEALVKENLTLQERSARLGDQVQSSAGRERAVQEALVTAQELREDILTQARREADLLRREAEADAAQMRRSLELDMEELRHAASAEADRVVEQARSRVDGLRSSLQELDRRRARFLKSFRSMLEHEMDDVRAEEERAPLDDGDLDIDPEWVRGASREPAGLDESRTASPAEGAPASEARAGAVSPEEGSPPATESADAVPAGPEDASWRGPETPQPSTQRADAEDVLVGSQDVPDDVPERGTWTSTLVYNDGEPADDRSPTRGG